MKDVHITHQPDYKYYDVDANGNETLWFDGDTGGHVSTRFSSGPTLGVKVAGLWVKPLPYVSHYVTTNGRPFDQRWTGSFGVQPFSHEKGVAVTGHIAFDPRDGCANTGAPSVGMPSWIISSTEAAALSKMKDDCLNLAVSIIETINDAPKMLESFVKAARLINDLRHSRYGDFFRGLRPGLTPKGAASAWLQFKFGIQPLMNDIHSGVQKIRDGLPEATGTTVVSREDPTYIPVWRDKPSWFQPEQEYILTGSTWTRSCRVGLSYAVPNPYIALADSLGLTNPAALLWQTMRLSFVIDWFLPIGPFLESLTTPLVYEFRGGYRNHRIKNYMNLKYTLFHPKQYFSIISPKDPYLRLESSQTSLTRFAYEAFPIPWPYPKFNLSTGQIGTAIALLVSSR